MGRGRREERSCWGSTMHQCARRAWQGAHAAWAGCRPQAGAQQPGADKRPCSCSSTLASGGTSGGPLRHVASPPRRPQTTVHLHLQPRGASGLAVPIHLLLAQVQQAGARLGCVVEPMGVDVA